MSRSYTSSPPQAPPWRVEGLLFLKPAALCPSEGKKSRRSHILRFYGVLKTTADYERDTS
jgi:hypothetical protein